MKLTYDLRRCRVLVVDDYPDVAEIACSLLEKLGQESRMANTGRGALEEASRFNPNIVILELTLPDISGLEVARALRARILEHPVHIAALTGWAGAQERDDAFAAGFDQYVVKPGNLTLLLWAAVRCLSDEGLWQFERSPRQTAVHPGSMSDDHVASRPGRR